jgi:tRNA threonylcarbamoyladenosine biosynthesis protein TsaE
VKLTLLTNSAEETRQLGAALGRFVEAGDVVVCSGELGVGKTVLAQGFGEGLEVADVIVSPTFVLVRSLQGRLMLHHADLWRLDDLAEMADLGLPELVEDGAVALVEWGEKGLAALGEEHLRVEMAAPGEETRTVELSPSGAGWERRWERLAAATATWGAETAGRQ